MNSRMYRLSDRQIDEITRYLFIKDDLRISDVIFIPGCARPDHTEEAARLYKSGFAPLLVPSGAFAKTAGGFQGIVAGGDRYGTDYSCEADFLKAVLMANGVPEGSILTEPAATYTLENAEKTRMLLESRGLLDSMRTAILCCKAHHARRAFLYYEMVFPELDILVHPVPIDGIDRDTWYLSHEGREKVLGELGRVGQQLMMMENRIAWGLTPS